jgi:protease II
VRCSSSSRCWEISIRSATDQRDSSRRPATGRSIPISIIYRKELERNGPAPLLLEGYGSYGISNDVDFSSTG